MGWRLKTPKATFYVWIELAAKEDSIGFSRKILDQADIIVTPGVGFGKYGEGYIRIALTVPEERINQAVERLGKLGVRS